MPSPLAMARQLAKDANQTRVSEAVDAYVEDVRKRGRAAIRERTGYVPRDLQELLLRSERRFNVEVIHRRFGKTVQKINKLIERATACQLEDGRFAYLAPTYSQAEDIAWHYLCKFTENIPGRRLEQSKLAVHIPNCAGSFSRIRLYGTDSPKQRLRGMYLDGVVFDEYAWIPPSVWSEQARPMLSDINRAGTDLFGERTQWADFIFTPFGRNHAYTLYTNAALWRDGHSVNIADEDSGVIQRIKRDDWYAAIHRASETGILSEEELAAARIDQGSSKYDQEYECSFDAAVEGAIFARQIEAAKAQGRVKSVPVNPFLPVNTAWDLGYDDHTAIWFFQQAGPLRCRFLDYYETHRADLAHYAEVLAERSYRYGYHLLPQDVEVTELGSGKSRRAILRALGIRVTNVADDMGKLRKPDMIAAAQALIGVSEFDREKCAEGLDRLSLYRRQYNEKTRTFSVQPVHDDASHGADALQHAAIGLKKVRAGKAEWSGLQGPHQQMDPEHG